VLTLSRADETSIVIQVSDILDNANACEMTGTFNAADVAAASEVTRPEKS